MIKSMMEAISTALYRQYGYENHMEEIKQGLEEPCFFIACIDREMKRYPSGRYREQSQFAIQYFPKSRDAPNAECLEVAEQLQWCLEDINVNGNVLHGSDMHSEIIDGVLNFFVSYNFFMRKAQEKERMENFTQLTKPKY